MEQKKKLIFCLRKCILKLFYDDDTGIVLLHDIKSNTRWKLSFGISDEILEFFGIWVIQLFQHMKYYGIFDKALCGPFKLTFNVKFIKEMSISDYLNLFRVDYLKYIFDKALTHGSDMVPLLPLLFQRAFNKYSSKLSEFIIYLAYNPKIKFYDYVEMDDQKNDVMDYDRYREYLIKSNIIEPR